MERLAFDAVAKAVGVADSTVRRWADKFGWRKEREELAKAESEVRAKTVKSRAFVLQKLLDATDGKEASQMAFAVASLERLALETAKAEQKAKNEAAKAAAENLRSQDEKNTAQEVAALPDGMADDERIALLEQGINRQISYVLANPVPDMAARVRDIKAALDVLAAIKGKEKGQTGVYVEFEE